MIILISFVRKGLNKSMRPTMRLATSPPNKHRTVFNGEELALFFRDGSTRFL